MKSLVDNERYVATPSTNSFLGHSISIAYFPENLRPENTTGDNVLILVKTKRLVLPIISPRKKLFVRELFDKPDAVAFRLMSSCITGLLGDEQCDCHQDMIHYLGKLNDAGEGIFVYAPQEAMGRGLRTKITDHYLQKGINKAGIATPPLTFEQAAIAMFPGEDFDIRSYHFLEGCFEDLGLSSLGLVWLGGESRRLKLERETHLNLLTEGGNNDGVL